MFVRMNNSRKIQGLKVKNIKDQPDLFIFPIKYKNQNNKRLIYFGHSFDNKRDDGQHVHGATDIFGDENYPVFLTSSQKIVQSWIYRGEKKKGVYKLSGDRGYAVRTMDKNGYVHHYSHLKDISSNIEGSKRKNDTVEGRLISGTSYLPKGTQIGKLYKLKGKIDQKTKEYKKGTGPHLHYQIKSPRIKRNSDEFNPIGHKNYDAYEILVSLAKKMGAIKEKERSKRYFFPFPLH